MADELGGLIGGLMGGAANIFMHRQQTEALTAAAGMFDALGTPDGKAYGALLRTDPSKAEAMAKVFGGVGSLYSGLQAQTYRNEDVAFREKELSARTAPKPPRQLSPEELAIRQQEADARALSAQASYIKATRPDAPDMPAAQTPTVISGNLRGEFKSTSQNFVVARDGYRRVQDAASDDSPAGNMALVFGFMKLLDPGSTVREGEYATAENARSVPDSVRNAYNRAINGERLTPNQRENFKKTAVRQYGAYAKGQRELEAEYKRLAKAHEVPEEQVVIDYFGETRNAPTEAAQPAEAALPDGLPPGSVPIQSLPDGSQLWLAPDGRRAKVTP